MKVYVVKHGDENEYDIVGIFSKREDVEKFVELAEKEDDRLFWHEHDVDDLIPAIFKLEDLSRHRLHIFYLYDLGDQYEDGKTFWRGWRCGLALIDTVLNYTADKSTEYSIPYAGSPSKHWNRQATIKAHTPEEAISIAEKIMVRL